MRHITGRRGRRDGGTTGTGAAVGVSQALRSARYARTRPPATDRTTGGQQQNSSWRRPLDGCGHQLGMTLPPAALMVVNDADPTRPDPTRHDQWARPVGGGTKCPYNETRETCPPAHGSFTRYLYWTLSQMLSHDSYTMKNVSRTVTSW